MSNLRRIALLLAGLALVVWPGCWVVVTIHHASICGWGFSGWFCDEPLFIDALHKLVTVLAPWASVYLVAWAEDRAPRQ